MPSVVVQMCHCKGHGIEFNPEPRLYCLKARQCKNRRLIHFQGKSEKLGHAVIMINDRRANENPQKSMYKMKTGREGFSFDSSEYKLLGT